jgi:WD repeat-containing protein 89
VAAVLAAEEPVSRLGFAGPDAGQIVAITAAEGLGIWSLPAGEPLALAPDLRPALAAAPPPPPPGAAAAPPPCDYLVDCAYDAAGGRLLVLAGARTGALGVWALAAAAGGDIAAAPVGDALAASAGRGGHAETVRGAAWDLAAGALCTGGEDCRLALWRWRTPAEDAAAAAAAAAAAGAEEEGPGKVRARHRQGWAPY